MSFPFTIQKCCVALLVLGASACLDPLVSDEVAEKGLVLPAGTEVPSAHDTPAIESQIATNDGVPALIPLLSAFTDGVPSKFWDFGPTPDFAAPIFILANLDDQGVFQKIDHNSIIDSIPGQPGYSPFWTVLYLEVTDAYDGELITSFAAIEEAQRLGLINAPVLASSALNCPVVAADVLLEVGGVADPVGAETQLYWQGMRVGAFNLGPMAVLDSTVVPTAPMYVLAREGQAALSEPERGVDITGDGDIRDSNNILTGARSDEAYTPRCRRVEVTLASDIDQLIDITLDETSSAISRATDLFNPGPVAGTVVAFDETDQFINCPQQMTVGAL
jgi:hypothetical protein